MAEAVALPTRAGDRPVEIIDEPAFIFPAVGRKYFGVAVKLRVGLEYVGLVVSLVKIGSDLRRILTRMREGYEGQGRLAKCSWLNSSWL